MNNEQLVTWIWMEDLKLEERILVWHIATHVYMEWCPHDNMWRVLVATRALANYMFLLLAASSYKC